MPKKSEDSLDTIWIETLQAVLTHRTFEAAAKALNCSQSTISNRIIKLEGWLGAPLFRRDEKHAWPNDLAFNFATHAIEQLEQMKKFRVRRSDDDAAVAQLAGSEIDSYSDPEFEQKVQAAQSNWWARTFNK